MKKTSKKKLKKTSAKTAKKDSEKDKLLRDDQEVQVISERTCMITVGKKGKNYVLYFNGLPFDKYSALEEAQKISQLLEEVYFLLCMVSPQVGRVIYKLRDLETK